MGLTAGFGGRATAAKGTDITHVGVGAWIPARLRGCRLRSRLFRLVLLSFLIILHESTTGRLSLIHLGDALLRLL